jgi:hypothetical protein
MATSHYEMTMADAKIAVYHDGTTTTYENLDTWALLHHVQSTRGDEGVKALLALLPPHSF